MPPDPTLPVRPALEDAVAQFLTTAGAIGPEAWDRPATDRWSVRQLFAHTVRGMTVMGDYLDAGLEASGPRLEGAAGYFRTALSTEGAHESIATRAEATAAGAPDDLKGWAADVSTAMLERAAATDDDRVLVHFAGWLRFDDYLVTRVAELVLHTFDLQMACGLAVESPPRALALVNSFLVDLADRADPTALALALTGRPQPITCNVLG